MKDIKLDLKSVPGKLAPLMEFLRRYMALIFILAFLCIYGFLLLRVNSLSQVEPSEDAVLEKLNSSQQPKIDQASVDKIKQLQGQNIEVQTLFKQARDNPFSE